MRAGGIEIACDESGSEGERLIGGNTDVFAHASVRLTPAEADAWLAEVRRRVPTPASQFFAGHILREKHLPALRWALGPDGPFHGRGHAFLIDKSFLVVAGLLNLLHAETGEPVGKRGAGLLDPLHGETGGSAVERARVLYREGPGVFGAARWEMFLASANDLLRTANGRVVRPRAAPFPQTVATLLAEPVPGTQPSPRTESAPRPEPGPRMEGAPRPEPGPCMEGAPGPEPGPRTEAALSPGPGLRTEAAAGPEALARAVVTGPAAAILADLERAAPRMDAARRARLGTGETPVLDPMIPAIVAAVAYWSTYGPVSIVHDRHTGLTPERLAVIGDRTGGRLARLTFAVSGEDARIQLADVLAGVARKLASDELNCRADPGLTELVRPYIDASSIWCDPFWDKVTGTP